MASPIEVQHFKSLLLAQGTLLNALIATHPRPETLNSMFAVYKRKMLDHLLTESTGEDLTALYHLHCEEIERRLRSAVQVPGTIASR